MDAEKKKKEDLVGEDVPRKKEKKEEMSLTDKLRENPWMVSTVVLGLLTVILLVANFSGCMTGNVIASDKIGQDLLDFYIQNGATGLELVDVEEISGMYQVNFMYDGAVVPIFVTRDGQYAGSMSELVIGGEEPEEPATQEVSKSDKPVVELFIMTHCPYGTQAEKGFIPMMNAVGDSVDATIRYVHYFMHDPEEAETSKQICIREEQADKYLDYLTCFLEGNGVVDENYGLIMEGKDPATCMNEVGVDVSSVNECVDSGKWEDYYAADSALSQAYGVQGSPTLVVNGAIVSAGRSPAAYLAVVCSAFEDAPAFCETLALSENTPNPYFGWEGTGASSGGSC